jgi:hypothetical protein
LAASASAPRSPAFVPATPQSSVETPQGLSASEWATQQLAIVRDSPEKRVALVNATYRGPTGDARGYLPYRRAALSFMHWQERRGTLNALSGPRPGSPWWRAVNDRLLRDGCEAVALTGGRRGEPAHVTVRYWLAFVAAPTAARWYRAHNASIVSAYVEQQRLAERENFAERFFMNVVLLRVLYAHALVGNPRFALGRFALLGRLLGDPRLGMAGAFLSLGRVLPDVYPLTTDDVATYVADENRFGRMLDYAVISPRIQPLYEWSAAVLQEPELLGFVDHGSPTYVWPSDERDVWTADHLTLPARTLRKLLQPR